MRLKRLDTFDFSEWVQRSGFDDEKDFWVSVSGVGSDVSAYDAMVNYLTQLGYAGNGNDQFRQFLLDQTGIDGTLYDLANQFFQGTWSITPSGDPLVTEGGDQFTTEAGDGFVTE